MDEAALGELIRRLEFTKFRGCLELHFGGGKISSIKLTEHFNREELEAGGRLPNTAIRQIRRSDPEGKQHFVRLLP